jgi:aspartyl-tRNA(Asn)/glutamyl-tRNA(Gln) amidotransferase subunit C
MLSREEVERIAHLARLELTPAEAGVMQAELNAILGMVDRMAAIDTAHVQPMAHPQEVSQPLREDAVTEGDAREAFQAGAPAVEEGLYLVPKVIE